MPISVASPADAKHLAPPLRALVRLALRGEGRRPGEIAVVLSDDATLRDLNRRYRKIPRATDVLSFSYDDEAGAPAVNGDIVISLERVAAQARRFRVSHGQELARLVVHGALHLAGLDHHRAAERRHMRDREERALREGRAQARALERVMTKRGFREALAATQRSQS